METIPYFNPATGETLGTLKPHTSTDVTNAVSKARSAFKAWSGTSIDQRVSHLNRGRRWLLAHIDDLVDAVSLNNGKPKTEALMADVAFVAQALKWYEENTAKVLADESVSVWKTLPAKRAYITYSPLGVVAIISPWNYPLSLSLPEVFSALAAGNCVVLKPSEISTHINKQIALLMKAFELPDGVFQMLEGGGDVGAALVTSEIDKIGFTGSTATGKKIMRAAADRLTPLTLELGGKDPAIVLDDVNIDVASSGVLVGGYYNCGQTCASIERLLIHKSIEDQFVTALKEKINKLKVGPSTGYENDVGPITFTNQKRTIKTHLDEHGSGNLYDGSSNFLKPVLVKGSNKNMVWNEETFGPVIVYDTFATEEEAVEKANSTSYGLGAVIWSGSNKRAQNLARKLYCGAVVINDAPFTSAIPSLPWGGVKNSGFGRTHGRDGLMSMSLKRVVAYDIQGQAKQVWWYPYSRQHFVFMKAFVMFISVDGLINKLKWLIKMVAAAVKTEKRL